MKENNPGIEIKPDQCCFCVGAGLTRAFVGSWDDLLNDTVKRIITGRWKESRDPSAPDYCLDLDGIDFFGKCETLEKGEYLLGCFWRDSDSYNESLAAKKADISLAEIVEYSIRKTTQNYIDSRDCSSVADAVCKAMSLIKDTKDALPGSADDGESVENSLASELKTLVTVIRTCLTKPIRHIINYNFDTILEKCLADPLVQDAVWKSQETPMPDFEIHVWTYGSSRKFSESDNIHYHFGEVPVSFANEDTKKAGDGRDIRVINIYHVHGICDPDITPMPIVFSEYMYNTFAEMAGNWSKQVMFSLMQRFDVVAVGFSGKDLNFRRIIRDLKISSDSEFYTSKLDHKIVLTLCMKEYEMHIEKSVKGKGLEKDEIQFIKNEYFSMVMKYHKTRLGIDVRLYDDYSMIDKVLSDMKLYLCSE